MPRGQKEVFLARGKKREQKKEQSEEELVEVAEAGEREREKREGSFVTVCSGVARDERRARARAAAAAAAAAAAQQLSSSSRGKRGEEGTPDENFSARPTQPSLFSPTSGFPDLLPREMPNAHIHLIRLRFGCLSDAFDKVSSARDAAASNCRNAISYEL